MKLLSVLIGLMVLVGSVYGGNGIVVVDNGSSYDQIIPFVNVETVAPHNRITDELVIPVTNTTIVVNSNNAFQRKIVIVNGKQVQQIIVNDRIVAVVPIFNKHGFNNFYGSGGNFGYGSGYSSGYGSGYGSGFNSSYGGYGSSSYGSSVYGFTDFDYRINKQFYDSYGNLVRQFVVNGYVIAQEIVPKAVVVQFVNAFNYRNFVVLKQLRSNHCKFSTY